MWFSPLYLTDGYKIGHKAMLLQGVLRLYGTWIPRSGKYVGTDKVISIGQQLTWRFIHNIFQNEFFNQPREQVDEFISDMNDYLKLPFDGTHFHELYDLGYLPVCVQSLEEGIETKFNIPHMTFINTVDGFAWLTLFLETLVSMLSWHMPTSAVISMKYRRNLHKYLAETDDDEIRDVIWRYLIHDFSARGLDPFGAMSTSLGHAVNFYGSDTLTAIKSARMFYDFDKSKCVVESVNASEHSVSCVNIFRNMAYFDGDETTKRKLAEEKMLSDWFDLFNDGILSVVSDTFSLFTLITVFLPKLKDKILARNGKVVIRPDSGYPPDIICGVGYERDGKFYKNRKGVEVEISEAEYKGVVQLLYEIFGGNKNSKGYIVLNPKIGCIYGDSITTDRQIEIYDRLKSKGFAVSNVVLGVGSYTYRMVTRDTLGFAAKGAWYTAIDKDGIIKNYNIHKDPDTDDGTKKSLKGLQFVYLLDGEYEVEGEVTEEKAYSEDNLLKVIYRDGLFFNQTTIEKIRHNLDLVA